MAENKNKTSAPVKKKRVPTDTYETIPYRGVYQNGIIEDYDGHFSKSYLIPDVNFDVEEEQRQETMIVDYEKLLNAIDNKMTGQLLVINRNIDPDEVRNNILFKPKSDGLNEYRSEFNNFIMSILSEGHNNMVKEKYWTVSTEASDIMEANDILKRADRTINSVLNKICHIQVNPCTIKERLGLIYDIYNSQAQLSFDKKVAEHLTPNGDLDMKSLAKMGVHSKSLVSPDYFDFKPNGSNSTFRLSENLYGMTVFIDSLPTTMSTAFLNTITDMACNMIASVTFEQVAQGDAAKMIKNKLNAINNQINKQQMDAAREGITNTGATSAELENQRDATTDLIMEIAQRNQRIFKATVLVTIFAPNPQALKNQYETLRGLVQTFLCQTRVLGRLQEPAFNMCLPLAQSLLPQKRVLTTESSCAFWPFSVTDLNQKDGLVYGINPESNNMIRYNRKSGKNYNAIVLGESGSGKSFIVKEEIAQKYFSTDEKIIIIDPQGEYVKFVEALGGTVITVSQNSHHHLNPLDMDVQYAGSGEDPRPVKCAEIEALVGVMLGSEALLGPIESNIIHKVGTNMYRGYYRHMQEMVKQGITCDRNAMPTLRDFYEDMVAMNEPQAQLLAQAIENYCIGSYAIFSERTDVDVNARLICYDVSDLKGQLNELGMHVCMTSAINTMIANGRHNQWTSLYIDEAHLYTKTKSAAGALKTLYKTIRKFKGMPTIITQNINDLLANENAEALLTNSSFILMMNQSPTDRAILADMYQISPKLLEYITDQSYGHGLLYNGRTFVPFENLFPQGKLSEIMTSQNHKEDEVQEISIADI